MFWTPCSCHVPFMWSTGMGPSRSCAADRQSRCLPGAFCPRLPSPVQALSRWLAWIRPGAHMLGLGTLSHRASILFVPSTAPPLRAATVENLEAFVHSHKRCMKQILCRHEVKLQSDGFSSSGRSPYQIRRVFCSSPDAGESRLTSCQQPGPREAGLRRRPTLYTMRLGFRPRF
jgi:hypothetical protein